MSSIVSIATPVRPTSPRQRGSSESRPSWVGRSNAIDSPVEPCRQQVAVALVGLLGARVARVLAHRPQLLAVHVAVNAPRVRIFAGLAKLLRRGPAADRARRRAGLISIPESVKRRGSSGPTIGAIVRCSSAVAIASEITGGLAPQPYSTFKRNSLVRWCCGLPSTSAGFPASTTTPSSMNTAVSATSRAKPTSCVTTIIVIPW